MTKLDAITSICPGILLLVLPFTGCNNSTLSGDAYDDSDDFVEVEIDENIPEPSENLEVLDDPPFDDSFHENEEESDDFLTEEEECVPSCEGRECGDDGCGGSCGACPERAGCDIWGQCHACGEMVLVPAGDFIMGTEEADPEARYYTPEHIVTLSAFYMDVCEVTNRQWRACVEAGACTPPAVPYSHTVGDYYFNPAYNDYPVIEINWNQASDYCQWEGKRLSTEAEWEKAARGGCELFGDPTVCDDPEDEGTFPWGEEEPSCEVANYSYSPTGESCIDDTDLTGARPAGASPYGVLDMAGNVDEWVFDWYGSDYFSTGGPPWVDPEGPLYGDEKLSKGGSYTMGGGDLKLFNRILDVPQWTTSIRGLRCARNII